MERVNVLPCKVTEPVSSGKEAGLTLFSLEFNV